MAGLLTAIGLSTFGGALTALSFDGEMKDFGYWSHQASLARDTNNLWALATREDALLRKHFTFIIMGRELENETVILPQDGLATNLGFSTAVAAWLVDSSISYCDYEATQALNSGGALDDNRRSKPRGGSTLSSSAQNAYEVAFEKLTVSRLVIFDGAVGPYIMFAPDGRPSDDLPIWLVQADLVPVADANMSTECFQEGAGD